MLFACVSPTSTLIPPHFVCADGGLGWTLLAIPLFSMPSFKEVTLDSMNYGSVVFVGFVAISAIWYWIWGYKNYAGPPVVEDLADASISDPGKLDHV